MRESLLARRKDMLQRLALVAVLVVVAFGGMALGTGSLPDVRDFLLGAFAACTLLWILDPAFQYLYDTQEDEEVQHDGDVA